MKTTKKQVETLFKELYSDFLKEYKTDIPAKREAWNNFKDSLCKDGEITQNQYNNWSTPKFCEK